MSIYYWVALEVALALRDIVRRQGRGGRDRGTRLIIIVTLAVPIWSALLLPGWVPGLDTPAPHVLAAVGIVVVWLGLGVRVWAVLTLGRSFRTFVEVDTDQTVVTRGPYRWVRHPSYTGLVLIGLGFGLAAGNWLSLLICAVVPLLGVLPRIAVEESELMRVLGEPYRRHQRTTRRLLPGLW